MIELSRSIIQPHGGYIPLWEGLFMREQAKTSIAQPHALHEGTPITKHSLSVILPAYNEAQVIANTVSTVHFVLDGWKVDFEIIVVNGVRTGHTRAALAPLPAPRPQILIAPHHLHHVAGAALVSGFAAATKELIFFMDADGQFDIS